MLTQKNIDIIKQKYPNHIPIIISGNVKFTKEKFLVEKGTTIGQFVSNAVTKNHVNQSHLKNFFLFKNNKLLNYSDTFDDILDKDEKYLQLIAMYENSFGSPFAKGRKGEQ